MAAGDSLRAFNVEPGEKLSAEKHNSFVRRIADMRLENAPGRRNAPSSASDAVIVKITGDADGGGKYTARALTGGISYNESGDLAMPEEMTEPGDDNVVVLNMEEDGLPTHWIEANTYAVGMWAGNSVVAIQTGVGKTLVPSEVGSDAEGAEAADTATWTRTDETTGTDYGDSPLDLWMIGRVVYNPSGDKKIYAYARKLTFTADGKLNAVSGETRYEVSDTCVEEAIDGGTF